jgi:hypothetical protein
VIAAVNGLAYGGGCEIVEATHLSVAGPEARFAKAEMKQAGYSVLGHSRIKILGRNYRFNQSRPITGINQDGQRASRRAGRYSQHVFV